MTFAAIYGNLAAQGVDRNHLDEIGLSNVYGFYLAAERFNWRIAMSRWPACRRASSAASRRTQPARAPAVSSRPR